LIFLFIYFTVAFSWFFTGALIKVDKCCPGHFSLLI
jgi:hypothetical protein